MSSPVAFGSGRGSIAIQIGRSSNKDRRRAGHLARPKGTCPEGYHWWVAKLLLTAFALGLPSLDITAALLAVGALGAGHAFAPSWLSGVCVSSVLSRSVRPYRSWSVHESPVSTGEDSPQPDRRQGGCLCRYRPGSGIADLWHRANTEAGHAPAKAWRPAASVYSPWQVRECSSRSRRSPTLRSSRSW